MCRIDLAHIRQAWAIGSGVVWVEGRGFSAIPTRFTCIQQHHALSTDFTSEGWSLADCLTDSHVVNAARMRVWRETGDLLATSSLWWRMMAWCKYTGHVTTDHVYGVGKNYLRIKCSSFNCRVWRSIYQLYFVKVWQYIIIHKAYCLVKNFSILNAIQF